MVGLRLDGDEDQEVWVVIAYVNLVPKPNKRPRRLKHTELAGLRLPCDLGDTRALLRDEFGVREIRFARHDAALPNEERFIRRGAAMTDKRG
jgi:hypothetical protein